MVFYFLPAESGCERFLPLFDFVGEGVVLLLHFDPVPLFGMDAVLFERAVIGAVDCLFAFQSVLRAVAGGGGVFGRTSHRQLHRFLFVGRQLFHRFLDGQIQRLVLVDAAALFRFRLAFAIDTVSVRVIRSS